MYRPKKSALLAMLITAATVFVPANAGAETVTGPDASSQNNESPSSVSSVLLENADSYVSLRGDQFSVDSEAESAFSQKDLQEIENEVKAQNEKINEAKADSNLEMKVAGDSVTFWEKGPKISSSDNDDIDPYFQEGRNGIEFHGTTVRLLMSKTTINRMGNGIAIGGIWVPEPVVSKILATAGVLGGVAPGGIYADFGIASIVTGAIMQTAIPQRVGFQ
ncbi:MULTISPECIES: hypothetical protein [unclassified Corynebacterium]|jgi:possible gp27|uniref:hypothetical protein n=1 Tax=Corynebacterium TaxID=1716 RepID=UPI002551C3DD|nr:MULTISPECIES: hypothetical protein [unclassified Corynebacterium]MDK8452752.1 hypothetical protein [Corynebacterium sp. MSK084]MDK8467026.1 hypothetical protein [Corynebacterium sp. MSK130]MDK8475381.1 hypothetical protein [Corynebacterium sp. MSK310]MDK8514703.1 hypothetical protein [Corynebacterium sp. MSK123]MDK8547909.1 hypothetical protein [Corynebacterium sp. MSK222]